MKKKVRSNNQDRHPNSPDQRQKKKAIISYEHLFTGRKRRYRNITKRLTTKTVEGTALALECVDNVEGGDGLALGVLGVGDGISDDSLEEGLEDSTGLLVDHWKIGQMLGAKRRRV